jgi:hypothetical protein
MHLPERTYDADLRSRVALPQSLTTHLDSLTERQTNVRLQTAPDAARWQRSHEMRNS